MKVLILVLLFLFVTQFGFTDVVDEAKVRVEKDREWRIQTWYAERLNDIENLRAKIKKIQREIKEFRPEEIECHLRKEQNDSRGYDTWSNSATLTLTDN